MNTKIEIGGCAPPVYVEPTTLEKIEEFLRGEADYNVNELLRKVRSDYAVVSEYMSARNAYEDATRPLNSHAPYRRLPHGDPVIIRYRNARASLAALTPKEQGNG